MIPIQSIAQKYGHPMAIVVQCCRVYFNTATIEQLNELISEGEVDWKYAAILSKHHRIRPIVFNILLQSSADPFIKNKLKEDLLKQTFLSNKKAKETERLYNLLKEKKILAVPYKGECYSKQFYGEIALRESSDIDFAIEQKEISQIIDILKQDGYFPKWEEYYHYIGHNAYVKKEKGFDFIKYAPDGVYGAEFHWWKVESFSANKEIDNNYSFETLESIKLIQSEIQTLNKKSHFETVYAHHNLADGLAYLKTCIDLGKGILALENDAEINLTNITFNLELVKSINNSLFGIHSLIKEQKLAATYSNFILSNFPKKINGNSFTFINYLQRHLMVISMKSTFYGGPINVFNYYLKSIKRVLDWDAYDFYQIRLSRKLKFLYPIIRPFRKIFMPTNHKKVAKEFKTKAEKLYKETKPSY